MRFFGPGTALVALAANVPAVAHESPQLSSLPAVDAALIAPAVPVADAQGCQAFYEKVLGMTTIATRDQGPIRETMLAFSSAPQKPAIILLSPASPTSPALSGRGSARLIVRVRDLDAVVTRMDAAGLSPPTLSAPREGIRVIHIKDPEANDLELVQSPERPDKP